MHTLNWHLHRSAATAAIAFAWVVLSCLSGDSTPRTTIPGSACERGLLTARDAVGILRAPVIGIVLISGDPESCAFVTASRPQIEITLRPARGRTTVGAWIAGKMPLEATPLYEVGDRAAWQRDLHEVIAERNDVLCDISVLGTEGDFTDSSDDVLEDRIGNLCNKILGHTPRASDSLYR
jgi:hypothetical protein